MNSKNSDFQKVNAYQMELGSGHFPIPFELLRSLFCTNKYTQKKTRKNQTKNRANPRPPHGSGLRRAAPSPLQPSTFFKKKKNNKKIKKPDITSVIQCGLCTKGGFSTHHSTVPPQLETKQTYASKTQDYMKK
jgi:hypothetical protein